MLKTMQVDIKAVPKPRQTRSDKWKERPCVMAYRRFADDLRREFGHVPADVFHVDAVFFIKMPPSWSQKKRDAHEGKLHRQKPDADNLFKAVLDALMPDSDCRVAIIGAKKIWATYDKIDIAMY